MVSTLFRIFLCTFLTMPLFSITSPMPQPAYTFTHDVERVIDARVDSGANILREGRNVNHGIVTVAGIATLITALVYEDKSASFCALMVCVYNMVQAIRKQHAIDDLESIKRIVHEGIYVRAY